MAAIRTYRIIIFKPSFTVSLEPLCPEGHVTPQNLHNGHFKGGRLYICIP